MFTEMPDFDRLPATEAALKRALDWITDTPWCFLTALQHSGVVSQRAIAEALMSNYSWRALTTDHWKVRQLVYRYGQETTWTLRDRELRYFVAKYGPRPTGRSEPWRFRHTFKQYPLTTDIVLLLAQKPWEEHIMFHVDEYRVQVEFDGIFIGSVSRRARGIAVLCALSNIPGLPPPGKIPECDIYRAFSYWRAIRKYSPRSNWLPTLKLLYSLIVTDVTKEAHYENLMSLQWQSLVPYIYDLPNDCIDWIVETFAEFVDVRLFEVDYVYVPKVKNVRQFHAAKHLFKGLNIQQPIVIEARACLKLYDALWRDDGQTSIHFQTFLSSIYCLSQTHNQVRTIHGIITAIRRRFLTSRRTALRRIAAVSQLSNRDSNDVIQALILRSHRLI